MQAIWKARDLECGCKHSQFDAKAQKSVCEKVVYELLGTSVGVGERGHKMQGERGEKTRGGGEKSYFRDIVHAAGVTLHDLPHQQAQQQQQQWRQFEDMSSISVNPSQITPSHLPDTQSGICSAD